MIKETKGYHLILLFIVFYFSANLFAQDSTKLRFIGNSNDYPYEFINSEGKPDGFSIDLIKAIAKVMNTGIDIKLEPLKKVNNEILYGNNFDISAMFYSENREQSVNYSSPVFFSEAEIFIKKETKNVNSITDLIDKKVAVEEGSFIQEYIERNLPGINLLLMESIPAALEALSEGKCDAVVAEKNISVRSIANLGITNLKTTAYPVIPREYGYVVPKEDSVLLSNINLGLAVLKNNGTYSALFNKWITQTAPKTVGIQTIFKWGIIILAVILLIMSIIFFWIKSLRRLVHIRTLDLQKEVAEHVKTEQELKIQKEKAEESNRLKSEFLAQMSHEIRSPLNVTLSFTNFIKDELKNKLTPVLEESFFAIDTSIKRVIRTIDLILNMSEMQLGTYEPTWKNFDLVEEVFNVIQREYEFTARRKGLDLIIQSKLKTAKVYGDQYSVTQIFVNLIDNAIKYTNSGQIGITIDKDKQRNVVVTVKDSGIGISEEYIPKLFVPFTQEEQGYSRRFEGNGLGLALVRKYCDLNNSTISVESKKGFGTTFIITFRRLSKLNVQVN